MHAGDAGRVEEDVRSLAEPAFAGVVCLASVRSAALPTRPVALVLLVFVLPVP